MRTSKDICKLPDGRLMEVDHTTDRPENAVIWNGYDYDKQQWIYNGKKDTRTLEELRLGIKEAEETGD